MSPSSFCACVRAGGLVPGAPRIISCPTSIGLCRSHATRRLRDLLPPDLLDVAAAYALVLHVFLQVSLPPRCCRERRAVYASALLRYAFRLAAGLLWKSLARCSRPRPAATCTLRPAHFARCVARVSRSSLCACMRACLCLCLCLAPRGSFRVILVLCRFHVTRRLRDLLPPDPPQCYGCLRFLFGAYIYRCL